MQWRFVFQFAARAQASLQLLACVWFLLTASQENKIMLTAVLSMAVTVCRRQMIQGSLVRPLYDVQDSFTSREHNAVIDNVAGDVRLCDRHERRGPPGVEVALSLHGYRPRCGLVAFRACVGLFRVVLPSRCVRRA